MSHAHARGDVAVLVAAAEEQEGLSACLASLRTLTREDVAVRTVVPTVKEVNRALEQLSPADVVLLSEPVLVSPGWLELLGAAAHADTNTATVSAFSDAGGPLSIGDSPAQSLREVADELAERTLKLHPRLGTAAGPCVYVRREALELVGPLREDLPLRWALEVDFAQRCVLSGLSHVAADDVVVARAGDRPPDVEGGVPAPLLETYPYLARLPASPESRLLARALQSAKNPAARLAVTLDARALDGAVTGTQVSILELAGALARTGELQLRVLVRSERIDQETLQLLRALPGTEVLADESVDSATPRTTIFHRPQQTFSPGDVALALRLGERLVLSQLDLIAYRNPGYFPDPQSWEDYRRASRHGLSAAERVVVFSDHTRRDLLSDALVDDGRIRIVPPGLDHRPPGRPLRPAALPDEHPAPQGGFLLCLGTDFRHKNRLFALRLLAHLREDHGWPGSLVLAGTHIPRGSSLPLERSFIAENPGLEQVIVSLGSVSEPERAWLMAHAAAVVYPSVYEGFGLVPFESALSGVPCLFAPQSSLAEVAPPGTPTIVPWDPAAARPPHTSCSRTPRRAPRTPRSSRLPPLALRGQRPPPRSSTSTARRQPHPYGTLRR